MMRKRMGALKRIMRRVAARPRSHHPTQERSEGPLPAFIIVGAQKAGTTSIAANLRRHPGIFMPRGELHFFDRKRNWEQGVEWYRAQFARGAGKLCGEKTPRYMTRRVLMERIHEVVPNVKIIVLLRDPVARLFSQINHEIQRGNLPFPEEISLGYLREHVLDHNGRFMRFVARGFYADQIEGNILEFFPRSAVFIRNTDVGVDAKGWSLTANPAKPDVLRGRARVDTTVLLLQELHTFLDVPQWQPEELWISHVRTYRAHATSDARRAVIDLYREPNERLFQLLGYEISEWTREPP